MTAARNRRTEFARLEQEAAALPNHGPVADLVAEIHAELSRLILAKRGSHEARPFLKNFGRRAYDLMGSVDGMRVICHKTAGLDPRKAEMRRDMLDKGWDGVGGEHDVWIA
ncbi:hypothetical protein [Methylobacterium sp. E-045]|uniref:hypothetical protein n=1 Tax=Methylobacterium sp. E-045 TaxID=2836575 RepID=UPI001FBACA0F|nr:hypothetical protein [Methylobacterium sp. E-045]MCJ2127297.1 hypothetical protein [Methylobacterium sp. E-045]